MSEDLQLVCYWCKRPFKVEDKIIEKVIKRISGKNVSIAKALVHKDCYK